MTTTAAAYAPGLKVVAAMRHTARRLLPIQGNVLVKPGDLVDARQVVAETFMPGDITPLNLAKLLSMPPGDLPECMLKKEGDRVEVGEQPRGILLVARQARDRAKGVFERGGDLGAYLAAQRNYTDVVRLYRDTLVRHRRSMLQVNAAVGRRIFP